MEKNHWFVIAIVTGWFLFVVLRVMTGVVIVQNWPLWVATILLSDTCMVAAGRRSTSLSWFKNGERN